MKRWKLTSLTSLTLLLESASIWVAGRFREWRNQFETQRFFELQQEESGSHPALLCIYISAHKLHDTLLYITIHLQMQHLLIHSIAPWKEARGVFRIQEPHLLCSSATTSRISSSRSSLQVFMFSMFSPQFFSCTKTTAVPVLKLVLFPQFALFLSSSYFSVRVKREMHHP